MLAGARLPAGMGPHGVASAPPLSLSLERDDPASPTAFRRVVPIVGDGFQEERAEGGAVEPVMLS